MTGGTSAKPCQKPDVTLTEQTSTLQYFARASGLALLALHLQVHHPTFNAPTVIPSFRSCIFFIFHEWKTRNGQSHTIKILKLSGKISTASCFAFANG